MTSPPHVLNTKGLSMLQAITLLAAMSATTGLMGHGNALRGRADAPRPTKVAACAMPTSLAEP